MDTEISSPTDASPAPFSGSETRAVVTPYAFKVADHLLGYPLAGPWRRAFAQLFDLMLVALLSSADATILALFAALTFLRAGQHLKNRPKRSVTRKLLRLGAALLLFSVIYSLVNTFHGANQLSKEITSSLEDESAIVALASGFAWQACAMEADCEQGLVDELGKALAEQELSQQEAIDKFNRLLEKQNVDAARQTVYQAQFAEVFSQFQTTQTVVPESEAAIAKDSEDTSSATEPVIDDSPAIIAPLPKTGEQPVGIMAWVDALIEDLGLGFGWAALYYSVFTAWWQGHTPGKRLLRIRVVKLDGSPLNLWESFGRYGGYGAGVATGLMGFMQVFWDPNRQAIQDKISETLVLYDGKAKHE